MLNYRAHWILVTYVANKSQAVGVVYSHGIQWVARCTLSSCQYYICTCALFVCFRTRILLIPWIKPSLNQAQSFIFLFSFCFVLFLFSFCFVLWTGLFFLFCYLLSYYVQTRAYMWFVFLLFCSLRERETRWILLEVQIFWNY